MSTTVGLFCHFSFHCVGSSFAVMRTNKSKIHICNYTDFKESDLEFRELMKKANFFKTSNNNIGCRGKK